MTLPSVLVTDTNIWIDLENGRILADVFCLPYHFFTTDFAVVEFIHPPSGLLPDCLGYLKLIIGAGSCTLPVMVALIEMVIMIFWILKSHAESQK